MFRYCLLCCVDVSDEVQVFRRLYDDAIAKEGQNGTPPTDKIRKLHRSTQIEQIVLVVGLGGGSSSYAFRLLRSGESC